MRKEDLKNSFEKIRPGESEKKRMLDNILNYSDRRKENVMKLFSLKKAIPALALMVVISAGLLVYGMQKENYNTGLPQENTTTDLGYAGGGRGEDAVAPIVDQFQIGGRHYILLPDDMRAEYGLPASVSERDIGEKIGNITNSPDKNLTGSEVYSYVPAGGEAIVAVKKDNEYRLFRFHAFESYINNQDEDAVEYLKLYGIKNAGDILKIQFIVHSENSKLNNITDIRGEITDRDEIARFYELYSVLKNSSDKYFNILFNYKGNGSANSRVELDDNMAPDKINPQDVVGREIVAPDYIEYEKDLPMDVEPYPGNAAEDLPLIIDNKAETGAGDTPVVNFPQVGKDATVATYPQVGWDIPAVSYPQVGSDTPAANASSGSGTAPVMSDSQASTDAPVSNDSPAAGSHQGIMDMGNTGPGQVAPSYQGNAGNALADPVTIRIYNSNGIYYDSMYYANIGFIERFEISRDFADFIGRYLSK